MMTTVRNACILLLGTLCFLAGCTGRSSSLLNDPNPYDAPLPPFSTPVTCEEVRLAFYKYSAPAIVKKLMENDYANWRMIMEKISGGDAEWISCAASYIKPGTDAGASEEFMDSLAYALQYNPEAVLSLDNRMSISMSTVCSLPFVEPEYDFVTRYGEKALAALSKVDTPYLQESRNICMQRLQRQLERADKDYQEGRWGY